jgi:DNA-binding NtrC family response regulator
MQAERRIDRELGGAETGRAAIVFVSASAEDAHALREIVDGDRWLVVNVPDLTGAQAVIDKLHPRLVVCDTEIEGRGSWRDLLIAQGAYPSFALIVVSRLADEALWAEALNLGGSDVLNKPFAVEEVERVIGRGLQGVREGCGAAACKAVLVSGPCGRRG